MSEPIVSVVTPFHNTAKYLDACIESVLRQTWPRFEYLLVNNQSTDRSAEIARTWAARDPRIRVVDQPVFLDQIANYNSALALISADSEYVKIVQADDTIVPECIERMVRVGELDPAVAIVGSYHVYGSWVLFSGVPLDRPVHDGKSICRYQLLSPDFLMGNPTTLMYRASCVRARNPFFAPGRVHEDTEACFEILETASFGFVPQVLSFVRMENDEGSISGSWRQYDWFIALRYTMLRRFGAAFLSPGELSRAETRVTLGYAWCLARAAVAMRGAGYIAFHRTRLAEVGEALTPITPIAWMGRLAAGFATRAGRALIRRLGSR